MGEVIELQFCYYLHAFFSGFLVSTPAGIAGTGLRCRWDLGLSKAFRWYSVAFAGLFLPAGAGFVSYARKQLWSSFRRPLFPFL